jgi:hypothetical protein
MKLKNFYRIDKNNKPVPGSNIRRKSKPLHAKWEEIKNICCNPLEVPCTCGPRYFVQIDYKGNPIEGTLVKRFSKPEGTSGLRLAEIDWRDKCCITYGLDYNLLGTGDGSLVITVNGVEVLNITEAGSGTIQYTSQDNIVVTLNNETNCANLTISGDYTFSESNSGDDPITTNFETIANGNYQVTGVLPVEIVIDDVEVDQPVLGDDGAITISATGDVGEIFELEYSIDDGATWQSSNEFTGLADGDYNVIVRYVDFTNCSTEYDSNPITLTTP